MLVKVIFRQNLKLILNLMIVFKHSGQTVDERKKEMLSYDTFSIPPNVISEGIMPVFIELHEVIAILIIQPLILSLFLKTNII